MQRSIAHKRAIKPYFIFFLFFVYTALSGLYIFLPPLLGVLYLLFEKTYKRQNSLFLILTILSTIFYEAQNGYVLFSVVLYFLFMLKYLMPKVEKNFSCYGCKKFMMVALTYIGFFIFYTIFAKIFMIEAPSISFYAVYYIVLEFFIVSLFL